MTYRVGQESALSRALSASELSFRNRYEQAKEDQSSRSYEKAHADETASLCRPDRLC